MEKDATTLDLLSALHHKKYANNTHFLAEGAVYS